MTNEPPAPENRLQQAHIDAQLMALVKLMARNAATADFERWKVEQDCANKKPRKK